MTTSSLLKPREVTACQKLAASDLPDSQRAAALLAIHQGATQAVAAQSAGLSIGQVKYIVSRYRRLGMQALKLEAAQSSAVTSSAKKAKQKDKKGKDKKKAKNKKDKDKKDKKKGKKSSKK